MTPRCRRGGESHFYAPSVETPDPQINRQVGVSVHGETRPDYFLGPSSAASKNQTELAGPAWFCTGGKTTRSCGLCEANPNHSVLLDSRARLRGWWVGRAWGSEERADSFQVKVAMGNNGASCSCEDIFSPLPHICTPPRQACVHLLDYYHIYLSTSPQHHNGWRFRWHGWRKPCRGSSNMEVLPDVCFCGIWWCFLRFRLGIYQRSPCHGLLHPSPHGTSNSWTRCIKNSYRCLRHPDSSQVLDCVNSVCWNFLRCYSW